jgi:hypothetical protein
MRKHIVMLIPLFLLLISVPFIGGCGASTITWQEEVKLLDGRVITVTQKRRIDGEKIEREAWLTFKLPEADNKEIVWHENLDVLVLNVYQNKIYIVGIPNTEREFRQYGSSVPFYIGYRYEGGKWIRVPFREIPTAIYDSNMYIENMAFTKLKQVSLVDKEELMKDETFSNERKRIDPSSKIH